MTPGSAEIGPAAFLFDMDGVIIDSTPIHNEAWQIYLRRHNIDRGFTAIQANMLGKHNDDIVRTFFGEGLPPEVAIRHGLDKERLYRELMAPRLSEQLVPGVAAFVAGHGNTPKAVATNAEPANLEFVLERSGLRPYFEVVVDGAQIRRPKPDPEVFLRAAALLGVSPVDCVVFEDSDTGIRAARAAGARVVGLTTTSAALEHCDLIITNFLDPRLKDWLQN
jgi:beta-phosphoglucomutase family hydrolase